ncbi:MAG: ACP S-malonyltransferase [Candidatus Neomarinimicrobiota bacterium]
MGTAFIFPGQASQKVGMGNDLFEGSLLGRDFFNTANTVLGYDIQEIIFNGPEELLTQTRFTQPAIYIVSVILGRLLIEKGVSPTVAAGHSLGEYSALTIAGSLDFKNGLALVKVRAENMFTAGTTNPGSMAAIIGLDNEVVDELCAAYNNSDGIVVTANKNTPSQTVISGHLKAVKWVVDLAKQRGALKAILLNVSGAFHSPLMRPAREALAEKINSIEIRDASIPVYANISAEPVEIAEDIKNCLIKQLEMPVLWHKTIGNMKQNGINSFIEVGPGRVLRGLNKRIDQSLSVSNVSSLVELNQIDYV